MMGGLFSAKPTSVISKPTNLSAIPEVGSAPAQKKKDEPPVIGPSPTLASLSLDTKRKADALGAAGMPQTIIKAPSFG